MKIKLTYKGGSGSGNFDHAGRPGKVGGSADAHVSSAKDEKWRKYDAQGPVTVFHGTQIEFVDDIKKNGLKRGRKWMGRNPSVYFAVEPLAAREWASARARDARSLLASNTRGMDWHSPYNYAVIEFKIDDSMDPKVIYDKNYANDFKWDSPFRIEQDIPAEAIVAIHYYNVSKEQDLAAEDYSLGTLVDTVKLKEYKAYAVVLINAD